MSEPATFSGEAGIEKRVEFRMPVRLYVEFGPNDFSSHGYIKNISKHGLSLCGKLNPNIHSSLIVAIHARSHPIAVAAGIRWQKEGCLLLPESKDDHFMELGLRLRNLPDRYLSLLEQTFNSFEERRAVPRLRKVQRVNFLSPHRTEACFSQDISPENMFLVTTDLLPHHSEVELDIQLEGCRDHVRVTGTVERGLTKEVAMDNYVNPGMAIRFKHFHDNSLQLLHGYLESFLPRPNMVPFFQNDSTHPQGPRLKQ